MLDRIDVINAEITRLSHVIEDLLAPWEEQLQQAESMPGWGRRSAEDAIAGTGVDMSRFATPARLASWAGRTPLDKQSGKRAGQAKHKRGNRYLGAITGETAVSAGKTDTREGAKLARSRGKAKACVSLGNTQMRVYHKLLSTPGARYEDLGADHYDKQRSHHRQVSHHLGKLSDLGYKVTIEPVDPETGELITAGS
jgi:transposase